MASQTRKKRKKRREREKMNGKTEENISRPPKD